MKQVPLRDNTPAIMIGEAGLAVTQQQTGAMRLLNPSQVLQDEGEVQTAQIIWNVLIQPVIRDRILRMRQVFVQHQQDLGYIALCAIRESIVVAPPRSS